MSEQELGPVGKLLSDPEKWCRGRMAEDSDGMSPISCRSESAVKWCLVGAAMKVYGSGGWSAPLDPVRNIVGPVAWFNDNPNTTHSMLMDVLRYTGV